MQDAGAVSAGMQHGYDLEGTSFWPVDNNIGREGWDGPETNREGSDISALRANQGMEGQGVEGLEEGLFHPIRG